MISAGAAGFKEGRKACRLRDLPESSSRSFSDNLCTEQAEVVAQRPSELPVKGQVDSPSVLSDSVAAGVLPLQHKAAVEKCQEKGKAVLQKINIINGCQSFKCRMIFSCNEIFDPLSYFLFLPIIWLFIYFA